MDDVYRYQRYVYDFTRKYYLFGRDQVIRELAVPPGGRVLEVGCGTARNLIKIARRYPDAVLFGLDASAEMLITARESVERAGLSRRIKLVQAYAEDTSPGLFGETAAFDRIVFSYSLSMIPDWKQALKAASGALASGGTLHVVDFGDLKGLGRIGERVLRRWLALFHVAPRDEMLSALEAKSIGGARLHLLPGRYAFVWTAGKSVIGFNE
ncbi:MAG: class I SAM-dependent methyltransferase [Alphaproteobacteria bacterium]|nr:class I SAM-dependent methyltransferase [Alphaproteobacteria bacterium]MBV9904772.1 class I SAM-dependent methyltransferase [Alphaproteobacteria bacterium]